MARFAGFSAVPRERTAEFRRRRLRGAQARLHRTGKRPRRLGAHRAASPRLVKTVQPRSGSYPGLGGTRQPQSILLKSCSADAGPTGGSSLDIGRRSRDRGADGMRRKKGRLLRVQRLAHELSRRGWAGRSDDSNPCWVAWGVSGVTGQFVEALLTVPCSEAGGGRARPLDSTSRLAELAEWRSSGARPGFDFTCGPSSRCDRAMGGIFDGPARPPG